MTLQPHDVAFHMIKIIKLISITTILVTGFIATGLLVYGAVAASLCPQDWKRDADGNCFVRRQNLWASCSPDLTEDLAHLVQDIRQRVCVNS